MSLYYQDKYVTLYHGDSLAEHREWVEASVLVTDPPYGIDYNSGRMRENLAASIAGDKDTIVRDRVLDEWRVRHGQDAPALMFGTWRIPRPDGTRALLIWDTKGALGMGDLSIPWKPSHQEIYVLGKGFVGRRTNNVLTYAPVQSMAKNGRHHPHEKPLPLMRDLISKCPPGVVADPCAGSGSTLIAAMELGRNSIGIEVDEAHCETIAKRLSQGVLDFGAIG